MDSSAGRDICTNGIVSWATDRGNRPTMEDYTVQQCGVDHMCGFVFDGHGGSQVARHLSLLFPKIILKMAAMESNDLITLWRQIDDDIGDKINGGSTCSGFIHINDEWKIYNCGDSRTYIIDSKTEQIVFKSRDHKPNDEVDRISTLGGFILNGRIGGSLAISRSFGDRWYTGVIPDPDVVTIYDGDMAVSISDGISDVLSDAEILSCLLTAQMGDGADALITYAKRKPHNDNLSAVVCEIIMPLRQ